MVNTAVWLFTKPPIGSAVLIRSRYPAIRAATREELYTRLHTARDYMEANLNQPLTIPQIARQACLSTHHFLRTFKLVFDETPHQYLTRRRMERARQMLLNSDVSVTQICFALGFESLGENCEFGLAQRRCHVGIAERVEA